MGNSSGALARAGLFAFAHFSHHLSSALLTPMLPWIRTAYGLDYTRSGLLTAAFSTVYGIGQLPMGGLADRVGRRLLIATVPLGAVLLACVLVAASQSYWQLMLGLVLMGVLGSAYHPIAGALLAQQVSRAQRGQAYGIHLIGGNGGLLTAPLLGAIIARATDWRVPYITLPLLGPVAGWLIWTQVREDEEPGRSGDQLAPGQALRKTSPAGRWGVLQPAVEVVRLCRPVLPLLSLMIFVHFVQQGVSTFLPLYIVDKHHVEPAIAATVVAIISGAGMVSSPLGGTLSDRMGRKPVILISIIAVGPFVYLLTLVPFGVTLYATAIAMGLARSLAAPVVDSLIADTVPAERRATAFGLYFLLNSEIGGLGVPLVGYIIDRVGLDTGFTALSAAVFGISLFALLVRERI